MLREEIEEIAKCFPDAMLQSELRKEGIKIRRRKSEKRFLKELKFLEKTHLFVSDTGFAGSYLESAGISDVFKIEREDMKNVKACELFLLKKGKRSVLGFGGGRALDVAKKVAFDRKKKLILVPTAPSHNGLVSRTASLYEEGKKQSFVCKFPSKVIIPFFLWKHAKRHIASGILDVLGSIISLQDVFLSHKFTGERICKRELNLSLFGIKKVVEMKSLKELERALIAQGLAMKNSSRYCSGSEHEVEKCLAEAFTDRFHGELVGVGTLLCAKIYSERFKEKFLWDCRTLFDGVVEIYRDCGVIGAIRDILKGEEFAGRAGKILKRVSSIRPERFTLWNVVSSEKVDFGKVLEEIESAI